MSIEVILKEHVEHLGRRGEVVKVADGYARNYLLPRKLALEVTTENTRQIERERAKAEAREAEERQEAEALNCGFFKLASSGRPWLAIDADPSTYDAEFDLKREETYEAALDRLGKQGLTRIFVRPGTPLAAQLTSRQLVDEDRSGA